MSKTVYYGYDPDTLHLFSWDEDIRYEGICLPKNLPNDYDDEGESIVPVEARFIASYFLSGTSAKKCLNVYSDDEEMHLAATVLCNGRLFNIHNPNVGNSPVCLCGPSCRKPKMVRQMVDWLHPSSFHACHLTDELVALGRLLVVAKKRWKSPRKLTFAEKFEEDLKADGSEVIKHFDPAMNADAICQMALCVGRDGVPAVNQIMRMPGISPFYGRILTRDRMNFDEKPVYIVRADAMEKYFPFDKPMARNYAAACVPIRLGCNEKFREDFDHNDDEADVFVATDYVPGIVTFMDLYFAKSGKRAVMSFSIKCFSIAGQAIVFRYDRAYSISGITPDNIKKEN